MLTLGKMSLRFINQFLNKKGINSSTGWHNLLAKSLRKVKLLTFKSKSYWKYHFGELNF